MPGPTFFERKSLGRRYVEWWTDDLPPLSGVLRFFFYTGLLVLAVYHQKSPVRGIELYANTDPTLFRPYGLLDLLGVPYLSPETMRFIIGVTVVAWICAAVGFLSRASAIVTACGVMFLHGMFLGSNALNHNWFLPMHALILMCFARSNDRWSVDYHLKHRRGEAVSTPSPSVADTGLARKAVLVAAVGYYFAVGVTKLTVAGPQWADGHTIAYFAAARGHVTPFGSVLAGNLGLCAALATASMVVEIGAFAALLSRRLRGLMLSGWTAMHLGIWLTMGPDYWENIVCFSLLIDWRGVVGKFPRPASSARPTADARAENRSLGSAQRSRTRAVLAASFLLPLFGAVALCQVFWWPLTNVYMYCSYFSVPRNVRADHPAEAFESADAAQAIARGYLKEQPPIEATEYMSFRTRLRLTGPNLEPHYVRTPPGTASWKQWILTVVRPVLIRDLAGKADGDIAFVPGREDYPAQRFLTDYVTRFRRSYDENTWRDYSRLEITYQLKDEIPIASVPLDASPR